MAVESTKWGIIYCPKGGLFSNPKKRWLRIESCLVANGISYDKIVSESTGSVDRLVNMLINNGYKTIVIVGGDSALNDAVNCLMQAPKEVRDDISLGIIPNGMMNDFAHFWDIDEDNIEKTVKGLKQHRVRRIDRAHSCHYEPETANSSYLWIAVSVIYLFIHSSYFPTHGLQNGHKDKW